jgi:hypothetical protein
MTPDLCVRMCHRVRQAKQASTGRHLHSKTFALRMQQRLFIRQASVITLTAVCDAQHNSRSRHSRDSTFSPMVSGSVATGVIDGARVAPCREYYICMHDHPDQFS